MSTAREVAQRIAREIDDADQYGNTAYTWYGYVSLEDVRELVAL